MDRMIRKLFPAFPVNTMVWVDASTRWNVVICGICFARTRPLYSLLADSPAGWCVSMLLHPGSLPAAARGNNTNGQEYSHTLNLQTSSPNFAPINWIKHEAGNLPERRKEQLGVLINNMVYDMEVLHPICPVLWTCCWITGKNIFLLHRQVSWCWEKAPEPATGVFLWMNFNCWRPFPFPTSCRDGYAFPPACGCCKKKPQSGYDPRVWSIPDLLLHQSSQHTRPGDIKCMPDHFEKNWTSELEAAGVICKHGRNIKSTRSGWIYRRTDDHERHECKKTADGRNAAEPGPG